MNHFYQSELSQTVQEIKTLLLQGKANKLASLQSQQSYISLVSNFSKALA